MLIKYKFKAHQKNTVQISVHNCGATQKRNKHIIYYIFFLLSKIHSCLWIFLSKIDFYRVLYEASENKCACPMQQGPELALDYRVVVRHWLNKSRRKRRHGLYCSIVGCAAAHSSIPWHPPFPPPSHSCRALPPPPTPSHHRRSHVGRIFAPHLLHTRSKSVFSLIINCNHGMQSLIFTMSWSWCESYLLYIRKRCRVP